MNTIIPQLFHWRIENSLDTPLRWRKTKMVRVELSTSMSDLFHEDVPHEFIKAVFSVMAACPQHSFQVLTKRPKRFKELRWSGFSESVWGHSALFSNVYLGGNAWVWPLPNVWLGVSVSTQADADYAIPLLLDTPAAVRWVSYEPAVELVDFTKWLSRHGKVRFEGIDWVVVGGEFGFGARPFDLAWARSAIEQGKTAGVPVFVKQLGAKLNLRHHKGADPTEWPEDLRVREWPVQ